MTETNCNGPMRRIGSFRVSEALAQFIEDEALGPTGLSSDTFWGAFDAVMSAFSPRNRALVAKRADLQARIDAWHTARRGAAFDLGAYQEFLRDIGYIAPEGPDFEIATAGLDPEVAAVAGPQLVAPLTNARYALNAANARWGSLYDALYGADALGAPPAAAGYDPARGAEVVAWAKAHLDAAAPLSGGVSHAAATAYRVSNGALACETPGGAATLADPDQFAGYRGAPDAPTAVLLRKNGLHLELAIDRDHPVGAQDSAGVANVACESALTAIMDGEDSVAAVDAADKVDLYRNWLGLMTGALEASFVKGGGTATRRLDADRLYTAPDGAELRLRGRALLLLRNVGPLMTNPAVTGLDGAEQPEEILDALVTTAIARADLARAPSASLKNARHGAVYIVKPKLHGPEEAAYVSELFCAVEDALELPRNTVKIGLMDEERRTTMNLKECVRALRERVFFINTGFLDRTGDEIHTSMEAGPMRRKTTMKSSAWIAAYEDWNVDTGLLCGFRGRAQIGKGMWAAPDAMADMLREKIVHPRAGANCAWAPSPTAATLHATHYHLVDVAARQAEIAADIAQNGRRARVEDLLQIPFAQTELGLDDWSEDEIRAEIENNAQGLLGYVVRWIDQGVGCSKVPDIHDVGLMEDRATVRISAQMLANWIHQGVVSADEVRAALRRMAVVVDRQNAGDPAYRPMAPDFENSIAFQAACELVFEGRRQPSGYTEPVLHRRRLAFKARSSGVK